MHPPPLLRDLVVVFLAAGAIVHLFHRLRVPSIVGLLIAGMLIGPHSFLPLIDNVQQVEALAEIGVILLMFSIGLDFTRERIAELTRVFGIGFLQMVICVVGTALVTVLVVDAWEQALFLGFLVTMTSTTVLLKLFLDRGEISTPAARLGVGICIVQDLAIVPLMLAIPLLSGQAGDTSSGWALARSALVLGGVLGFALWLLPHWLRYVVHTRNRELFLIFLVVVVLGTAWVTAWAGLSLALGAFLAGLALAGSEYSHQTMAEVIPFRDSLVSLFFISVGMLIDLSIVVDRWGMVTLVVLGILGVKFLAGAVPVLLWGYPLRVGVLVGLVTANMGEFAFVMAHSGRQAGLIPEARYHLFLLAAVITMLLSPLLMSVGPRLASGLARWGWLRRLASRETPAPAPTAETLENHVVIAGYGLNGRNLVRALSTLTVPYAVLELNPVAVTEARERGENLVYGDCTRVEVLKNVHLEQARVYVVAISDAAATRQTVQVARHLNPRLTIVVRTRYVAEIEALHRLGADEVITEEFETSIEILAWTLHAYQLPRPTIDRVIEHFRLNAYHMLRSPSPLPPDQSLLGEILPAMRIDTLALAADSPAVGKSLGMLEVRSKTGAMVLAVRRSGQVQTAPGADFTFEAGDVLVLVGTGRQLIDAGKLLAPPS